jgi:tRNA-specific 2-thiouridylase
MSGGVDSAVAALLAAEHGEAVGVTLELWSDPENDGDLSCCSAQAVRGARALAHGLGMAHVSIDLRAEFRAGVVEPWLAEHAAGLTPNPCVRCNGNVRLDAMIELADRLGCATLATGHYARVVWEDEDARRDAPPLLRTAADEGKDQSYVLAALSPGSLARLRFPLGDMHKSEVRALAERAGLPVARRPDSQDLCFLAGTRKRAFLARHGSLESRPGPIVDAQGRVLGEHEGAHLFTVGQRRGIRIGGATTLFVLATDARSNTITVGPRSELLSSTIALEGLTLRRDGGAVDGVRVRSHGRKLASRLAPGLRAGSHPRAQLQMLERSERAAPGQLACLYAGDVVVGHATIAA